MTAYRYLRHLNMTRYNSTHFRSVVGHYDAFIQCIFTALHTLHCVQQAADPEMFCVVDEWTTSLWSAAHL